ncbi:polyprenyl synthetase family protein [Alkalihalobacillus sp. LMS39]|uniref:polyprenyl synthetase family protein n=1 Tax=Alkalihalobacillus sp. LMS39 TaxID=2924032 RepID=UPI001FB28C05|nr:farnesyl diphosphate synthase [Alkalihalobacillus sp. LMS39]UOE95930.1 polyprenyl synthetase family protein [Alkalihalobacillus sp. LMS39]
MKNERLQQFLAIHKQKIDEKLPQHIQKLKAPEILKEAMIYSLQAGGKRVRPMLLLATLHGFNQKEEIGIDVACAIEMIHTYSLIHDDLPAMDDDDMRRGKPTNHKVYGEALAILAGDALLTYSFQLIAGLQHPTITADMKVKLIDLLAKAAGPEGMVGGQVSDLDGEGKTLQLDDLEYIHHHKTGDLLAYSVVAGAILANAVPEEVDNLHAFAKELGLVFQIKDDILDVEGDEQTIGKPIGSDEDNNKVTYPSLLTMDGAKAKLNEHTSRAKEYLYKVNMENSLLEAITEYIAERDH